MGELLGQGEAVRASGEKPGGNYRFRHKECAAGIDMLPFHYLLSTIRPKRLLAIPGTRRDSYGMRISRP